MKSSAMAVSVTAIVVMTGVLGFLVATSSSIDTALLERLYYLSQITLPVIALIGGAMALMELRNSRSVHEYGQFEATAARISSISRLLLEHPEAYKELKTLHPQTDSALLLAESVLDIMDTELLRAKEFSGRKGVPDLSSYFSDLFCDLPGLGDALRNRSAWYSSELLAISVTELEDV